ncbi:NAD synthetase [Petrotoga miotherma DSM 10691]|uniref:Glutamine-dependent NAD(+) synthetase n=2 Tax=Petrotoga TaxID=28236 RepID=A0A2K1PG33_9BACT|nr:MULTISPECIES: NAD+ synthase [Petrotoga]MBL5982286.1 NAD synthetase [Petrotoga sp. 8T1HF07.NaAc.6.1]PNS01764.1 NAD synthetase [Petrotoga miotherma DSM 10691]POZ90259.1 NAD synthetase [Petrotoga halophila DSM 16923]
MKIRISLAQMNSTVGDYQGNIEKIKDFISKADEKGADLILFPELTLNGYPPEDLILKTQFLRDSLKSIEEIQDFSESKDVVIVLGAVDWDVESYNTAFVIYKGEIYGSYKKMFLPNYSVFDEKRYFTAGRTPFLMEIERIKIGITICEDLWVPNGPAVSLAQNGANLILNLSSSPFYKGRNKVRFEMLKTRASELSSWIAYCNNVGGQDELVFDGGSVVINPYGEIELSAPSFEEGLYFIDIDPLEPTRANLREGKRKHYNQSAYYESVNTIKIGKKITGKNPIKAIKVDSFDLYEQLYLAVKTGIKDYVWKNGFQKVVLGLSGGIDSSLTAAIAADAIGPENVLGLLMPSQYSSKGSIDDSIELSKNLGINYKIIPINDIYEKYIENLKESFKSTEEDKTEENIQARIRGNLVMAFSNKYGYLALACGNKSEAATGYATMYGDMAGGFSPIKDLYKTDLYKVARKYNELHGKEIIIKSILEKPPSAELRPNQKDEDTLPPYALLDEILFKYIDREMSYDELLQEGYDEGLLKNVINMVNKNEYKRRQSAPGIKLTERSFGKDRRMPITNKYIPW